MKDEVTRLGAQRIQTGWRELVGTELDGGSSSPLRDANVRMGKEKVADGTGRFEASAWLRAALRRRGSPAVATRGDARRRQTPAWAATVDTLLLTVNSFETKLTRV